MEKKLLVIVAGALLLALGVGIVTRAEPAEAAPDSSLAAVAPARVEVGQPIEITLRVRGATNVGGYETNLLFDTKAAGLAGLDQLGEDLTRSGRDVGSLGPVEHPWGASIGAFSCPVEECTRPGNGPEAEDGIGGTVEPASVTIVPTKEGRLEFRLAATKFVDATGKPLQVSGEEKSFVVQVGPGKAGPPGSLHGAREAAPWDLKSPTPSPTRSRDLTGDERVTHADAMEAAIAWTTLREGGSACGGAMGNPSRDINGDGCVDVADVQAIVSDYGAEAPSGTEPIAGGASEPADGAPSLALAVSSLFDWFSTRPALAQAISTFTVNSTGDGADANAGNGVCATSGGVCTLRAAIQEANLHVGPDTIAFGIPGTGVKTITLGSTLPTINDETGSTTIDGYTQPGASPNTASLASNAKIMVQITASNSHPAGVYGLTVSSPGNQVRGISIFKIRRNIWLYGPNSTNNTVAGSFIGTDAAGSYRAASFVDDGEGVRVQNQASSNNIGVASAAGRNVISGNARRGISFFAGSDSNRVVNNIIGLGPAGNKRLANWKLGIDLNLSAANNRIGGTQALERNVVSGNGLEGIELSHGTAVTGNEVVGNFVGTDLTGNAAPAYASHPGWGVQIEDQVTNNVVANNVIGNSTAKGGVLVTKKSKDIQIRDNRIGISRDGTPIPNALSGVQIDGVNGLASSDSQVGPDNVIANNGVSGIRIFGAASDRNTITRNSTFGNTGLGIDLPPLGKPTPNDPGDTDSDANEQLNFPVLKSATPLTVTGTACGGCIVEVFKADSAAGAYGEGKTFVGTSVAGADGNFAAPVTGVSSGDRVTATATDTAGNTSEFSPNKAV